MFWPCISLIKDPFLLRTHHSYCFVFWPCILSIIKVPFLLLIILLVLCFGLYKVHKVSFSISYYSLLRFFPYNSLHPTLIKTCYRYFFLFLKAFSMVFCSVVRCQYEQQPFSPHVYIVHISYLSSGFRVLQSPLSL